MVRVSARAGRRVRMERGELRELHYIAPIVNLASIARYGILSHARAARVVPDHESVADETVQGRRAGKRLPSGRALHEYANLYLNARNPMLYRRCHEGRTRDLCVLRIDVRVLDRPGAYVADRNAASDSAGIRQAPDGLAEIERSEAFAYDWRRDDALAQQDARAKTMAEALIPDRVPPDRVAGAYVVDRRHGERVGEEWPALPCTIEPDVYFGFCAWRQ